LKLTQQHQRQCREFSMGTLTEVERVAYENDVKHAYQSGGSMLDQTVRVKSPRPGHTWFRKFGILDMIPRGDYKSILNAIDASHDKVECTVGDFVLPVLTDDFEQAHSGGEAPQEQNESATAAGYGMRRQRDYSVIAALEAGTPALTVTAGSGLVVAKLREGLKQFDKHEMRAVSGSATGDSKLYGLITENQHDNLLADALTQSIDTANFKSLVEGSIKAFCGYDFILIGTGRGTKGLQATGATRRCYAYVKSALGQAVSMEPKVEFGRELLRTSDAMVAMLSLGSVLVDAQGSVQFDCTES
jgi:hypothetical protein